MASGAEIATAWVRLVPTVEGIQGTIAKEFGGVQKGVDSEGQKAGKKYTSGVGRSVKGLAAVIGGAFVVSKVTAFFADSMDAVQNWQTLNAQTAAVVKSTGGAAGVTAQQVNELAQALEGTTATEAEAVQEGANMLLTFKNIRNEVGEGNDIFNQSTEALVDMARAMGQDPKTAAIQLGKALNDPVQGISALSRVGIQFTEDQKDLIKSLVDSGQTMEAQKIILGELNSQFGGSGASYADTYAGKLFLLQDAFGDMGEAIVSAVVPALADLFSAITPVFNWLTDNQPVLIAISVAIGATLVGAFIAWTASIWAANAALLANPITWIILALAALVAGIIWVATQTTFFQDVWSGAMDVIGTVATWLWETILKPVFDAIGAIFTWLWTYIIKPIVTGIVLYVALWAGIFTWLWNTILKPVFDGIGAVFQWVWNTIIQPVINNIVAGVKAWGLIFDWLYKNAIKPAVDNVGRALNWVWTNVIRPVVNFINGAIDTVGRTVRSVFSGIANFIGGVFRSVVGVVRGPINAIINLVNGAIRGLNRIRVTIPDWVPFMGGQTFGINLPTIPLLAEGGTILQSGVAIVGERGPEMVRLPRGAVVDPDIPDRDSGGVRDVTLVNPDPHVLFEMFKQELGGKVRLV